MGNSVIAAVTVPFGKIQPRTLLDAQGVSPAVVIHHARIEREDFKSPSREKSAQTPMTTSVIPVDTETIRVNGGIKRSEAFPQKTPFEVFIHRLPSNLLATVTLQSRSIGGNPVEQTVHLQRPAFGPVPWRVLSRSKQLSTDAVNFVKDQVMKAVDVMMVGLENRELTGATYRSPNNA